MAGRRPPARRSARSNGRSSAGRPTGASRKRDGRPLPGWVWLLLGAAITLFVVVVVHLAQPRRGQPVATPIAKAASVPAHARPVKPSRTEPVPVPPKQPPRFSFYHLLPSREVVIPDSEAKQAAKADAHHKSVPAAISAPGDYVIQVGAYRSRDEAERARASVALLGVEAHTEQVTLSAGNIWYRVRVGPEPNLDKAQAIVDRLNDNGVKTLLIKQKS